MVMVIWCPSMVTTSTVPHEGLAAFARSGNVAQGRLELEWVRMGSYYLEPRNAYRYAGHNLFNVRGSWDLKPNVTVYVRLLNATDRDYAKRADYTSFTDERYFPGTPRSFGLGVDYVW